MRKGKAAAPKDEPQPPRKRHPIRSFLKSVVLLTFIGASIYGYLRARDLKRVFLVGLATDFCVGWSAVDARKDGFEVLVIEDACRGIDAGGSLAKAWADMSAAGVQRIKSADLG